MYDFELLIVLPNGDDDDRALIIGDSPCIRQRARRHIKKRSDFIEHKVLISDDPFDLISDDVRATCKEINAHPNSRITIFGHGDPMSTTVGGRTPFELSDLLRNSLDIVRVQRISLISCFGGGALPTSIERIPFAETFHYTLLMCHEIRTEVSARTDIMRAVLVDGVWERHTFRPWIQVYPDDFDPSERYGDYKRRDPGYKRIWRWNENSAQECVDAFSGRIL